MSVCTVTNVITKTWTFATGPTIYTPYTVVNYYTTTVTTYVYTWRTTYDIRTVYRDVTITYTITTTTTAHTTKYVTEVVTVLDPVFTKYVKTLFIAGKLIPTTIEVPQHITVVERVGI